MVNLFKTVDLSEGCESQETVVDVYIAEPYLCFDLM